MASNHPVKRRHFYDTLRRLLARPLRQNEVETLKIALDDLGCPVEPPPLPETIGVEGIALIKRFEGCARRRGDGMFEAYPDPGTGGPPWTIGWGATRSGLHGKVTRETVWTQAQCDERLIDDLERYAQEVTRALGDASRTRNQFDALVSFHYNTGAIARATLTKKHIAGDYEGAAREFGRWVYAGGRVLKGLEHRRAAEAALYRGR
ncbi:MAG: lysozyme [Erythrobacter sp.]